MPERLEFPGVGGAWLLLKLTDFVLSITVNAYLTKT